MRIPEKKEETNKRIPEKKEETNKRDYDTFVFEFIGIKSR